MFITPFHNKVLFATSQLSCDQVAFFVSGMRSWPYCFNGSNPQGQRNLPAMRDQNFQDLMRKHNKDLRNDGPGNVNASSSQKSPDEANFNIDKELDSQVSFKQFLKRSLPNRKPSSEFIQSIKDRIKIIETPDSSI